MFKVYYTDSIGQKILIGTSDNELEALNIVQEDAKKKFIKIADGHRDENGFFIFTDRNGNDLGYSVEV